MSSEGANEGRNARIHGRSLPPRSE
jgi:hypothetical protein